MAIAVGSLVFMALLSILIGAFRSVRDHKEPKKSGEKPDTMTQKDVPIMTETDAADLVIKARLTLLGLFILFQFDSIKDYINYLFTGCASSVGILALTHLLSPVVTRFIPSSIPNIPNLLLFRAWVRGSHDLVCMGLCSGVGIWYLLKKHWIANNLLGFALAVTAIEFLKVNKVVTGCIVLVGFFFHDIFCWVFGTNVMVTVAIISIEAPIILVFPQDLLEKGLEANNFAMLGLGDLIVPGMFIALLLRFDNSLKRKINFYFNVTFLAYFLGLMASILGMHIYRHAQPVLLYLVPAFLGTPLFLALVRGDIKTLFKYEEHPAVENKTEVKKDN